MVCGLGGVGAAAAGSSDGGDGGEGWLQVRERQQGQLQGRGEASGIGDALRAFQPFGLPFAEAVGPPFLPTEIGGEINEGEPLREAQLRPGGFECRKPRRQLPVGQGAEEDRLFAGREPGPVRLRIEGAFQQSPQVWMHRMEGLASVRMGRALQAMQLRMLEKPAQQLSAAIAGGAENERIEAHAVTAIRAWTSASTVAPRAAGSRRALAAATPSPSTNRTPTPLSVAGPATRSTAMP